MENFIISLNAVLPLMLCMAVGYLTRCAHFADEAFFIKCNAYCFKTFMSVMLFINVYDADISSAFQPKLFVFTILSILFVFGSTFLIVKKAVGSDSRRAVLTQGIARSNYVIFGIPIAANLYGDKNIAAAALLSAVAVPLFNFLSVTVLEYYSPNKTGAKSILKGIATNPLILGAVTGLLFKAAGIVLPTPIYKAASDLAKIATPLSLVILGATFKFGGVRKNLRYLVGGVLGKIVIVPLVMIPLSILCGFRGVHLLALTILFASPTAVSSFTMAQAAGHDGELAAQQVVFTSCFSLFTVFLWIFFLKSFAFI